MIAILPPTTAVLVLTPPPVCLTIRRGDIDARFPGQNLELDRTVERTREYAKAVEEVVQDLKSERKNIACVELHDAMVQKAEELYGEREAGLARYLSDGLHLTAEGYIVRTDDRFACSGVLQLIGQFVTKEVLQSIDTHFPQLNATKMATRFP